MRVMFVGTCLALALAIVVGNSASQAEQKDGPKYTISDVMKKAHAGKDALLTKVKSGKATEADGKRLLEMYEALSKSTPPKGDPKDWTKRTDALVEGAKLYVSGKKDDAVTKLDKASNCKACHSVHRG